MNIKVKKIWNDWNQNIVVNKRELILGVTACTLAGVLLGMFLSPRKNVTIGSNNGGNISGSPVPPSRELTDSSTAEEFTE